MYLLSINERKVITYQTKQFSTFTKDIKKLMQCLIDNNRKMSVWNPQIST